MFEVEMEYREKGLGTKIISWLENNICNQGFRKLRLEETKSFYFIYDNNLVESVNLLVKENKIELYTTHVQIDELDKIPDIRKKEKIKSILCTKLLTYFAVVGVEDSKRGLLVQELMLVS